MCPTSRQFSQQMFPLFRQNDLKPLRFTSRNRNQDFGAAFRADETDDQFPRRSVQPTKNNNNNPPESLVGATESLAGAPAWAACATVEMFGGALFVHRQNKN